MRFLLILCAATAAFAPVGLVFAQGWKVEIDASLMLTQSAYSNNWAGGDAGSVSWTLNSNWLAEKQLLPRVRSRNTLKLAFGQTHSQDKETRRWARPVKSTDLIDLESVLHFTLGQFVDPFVAGRVETQFLDTDDPAKDRFLNPVKFTESLGLNRVLIREDKREWSARLGVGLRQHVNRNVLDPLTGRRQTERSNDGGIEFVSDFKTALAQERISLTSKLTVFRALFRSESEELNVLPNGDAWKSPDVNWENIFTATVTEYLMVNLYVQFLYDKQIALGGRLKQSLSLGLTYRLM